MQKIFLDESGETIYRSSKDAHNRKLLYNLLDHQSV